MSPAAPATSRSASLAAGGARHARHRRRHQRRDARGRPRARRAQRGSTTRSTFVEANAEALPFADKSFDAVTIAFGIRNVPRIDVALARGASRAEDRRALPLPGILRRRRAGARRALRALFVQRRSRRSAARWPATPRPIAIWSNSIRRSRARRVRRHDARRRLPPRLASAA